MKKNAWPDYFPINLTWSSCSQMSGFHLLLWHWNLPLPCRLIQEATRSLINHLFTSVARMASGHAPLCPSVAANTKKITAVEMVIVYDFQNNYPPSYATSNTFCITSVKWSCGFHIYVVFCSQNHWWAINTDIKNSTLLEYVSRRKVHKKFCIPEYATVQKIIVY